MRVVCCHYFLIILVLTKLIESSHISFNVFIVFHPHSVFTFVGSEKTFGESPPLLGPYYHLIGCPGDY